MSAAAFVSERDVIVGRALAIPAAAVASVVATAAAVTAAAAAGSAAVALAADKRHAVGNDFSAVSLFARVGFPR